jgi:glycosyltransferase involved in cell wall biosynthesis
MWPVAKRLYHQADLIITISEGIAHELESTAQIEPNKMKVIHNPIELPINEEDPIILPGNKNSDNLIILAAGRLTPLKNFPMLLKASALVSQEYQIELFILGDGPERQHLDDLSRKLNISSHVHFMGFVSNPQDYFAHADIFTLTSNHEGFGNVIVEAMAMGVPVIATDCPYGPREILQGGESGILVPVDDENALAVAILDLLDQSDKLEHLARAGKSRARDFSIQEILPQYEQAFLELIEQ